MSVRKITLSKLPMGVLLIFLDQHEKDEPFVSYVLQEIKNRYQTYPTYRLCLLQEKLENERLRKLCIDVLYEQLQCCDSVLEVHSLSHSLQQMSLERLCHLSMQYYNELIRRCACEEIESRLPKRKEYQEEQKRYQKTKRRLSYAKYKRK